MGRRTLLRKTPQRHGRSDQERRVLYARARSGDSVYGANRREDKKGKPPNKGPPRPPLCGGPWVQSRTRTLSWGRNEQRGNDPQKKGSRKELQKEAEFVSGGWRANLGCDAKARRGGGEKVLGKTRRRGSVKGEGGHLKGGDGD